MHYGHQEIRHTNPTTMPTHPILQQTPQTPGPTMGNRGYPLERPYYQDHKPRQNYHITYPTNSRHDSKTTARTQIQPHFTTTDGNKYPQGHPPPTRLYGTQKFTQRLRTDINNNTPHMASIHQHRGHTGTHSPLLRNTKKHPNHKYNNLK